MGSTFSLSEKAKKNYDKIFGKKEEGVVAWASTRKFDDDMMDRLRQAPLKFRSSYEHNWSFNFPPEIKSSFDYPEIRRGIYERMLRGFGSPYAVTPKESFSNEIDNESNDRIMVILNKAKQGGFNYSTNDYRAVFERSAEGEKSITSLALRGLFCHPAFIKAYFNDGKVVDVAKYHTDLLNASTIEEMITYLERFL